MSYISHKFRRADRSISDRAASDEVLLARAAGDSFKKGFLCGLAAQVNMIKPAVSVQVYKGKGLAGDWKKVGGDIRAAMEYSSYKK